MTDFTRTRALFDLPEGVVYLDGNSLGPLPKGVAEKVARTVREEWGAMLIRGWNDADWIGLPEKMGDRIAKLIGAPKGTVTVGDSTSVNLFKVLTAALSVAGTRRVVLSDNGNFPNDLYVAQEAVRALGMGYELKVVAPEAVASAIDDTVAVLMLTEVDYRTGRLHDMKALTAKAHEAGAITIWDLCHSAGALPIDLHGTDADFAVGCGYKYLNGGPGAPAFVYCKAEWAERAAPALAGWMGHAEPFAFDLRYRPGDGISRMRVGTPPILSMAALDAALDVWDGVDMNSVRARSLELSECFIREVEGRCPRLELASPREAARRGSQVSFRFKHGFETMQALIAAGVIGDFRAPDIMRFGFTPLYLGLDDVLAAVDRLEDVMKRRLWEEPVYAVRAKVT
jgi:kynureninase